MGQDLTHGFIEAVPVWPPRQRQVKAQRESHAGDGQVPSPFSSDVPPVLSSTAIQSPTQGPKEIALESALFRSTVHQLLACAGSRPGGQRAVPPARLLRNLAPAVAPKRPARSASSMPDEGRNRKAKWLVEEAAERTGARELPDQGRPASNAVTATARPVLVREWAERDTSGRLEPASARISNGRCRRTSRPHATSNPGA